MHLLKSRLKNAFSLTLDLLESLDEKSLSLKISNVPSNSIGGQFWCILGARQSYLKAIKHKGEWQGFSCDLTNTLDKNEVKSLLIETNNQLEKTEIDQLNSKVIEKAFELLEHEIQHHGQLMRFVYANKLKFPESWNKRYTV